MSVHPSPSQLANYSDLFLRLLDTAMLVDPESFEILENNDASERMLELPMDSLKGRRLTELVPPELVDDFSKKLRMARRRYYPMEIETQWLTANGRALSIKGSICPLKLHPPDQEEREILQIIARDITQERADQAKLAMYMREMETLNQKLEAMSVTDEMTGIWNFRRFKDMLAQEHDRAARYKTPYAIVFIDADNFKHYNDRNGHPAGDKLLRNLADLLKSCVRNTDLVARYGGEEFAILCPHVGWEGAMVLAERLRATAEAHPFPNGEHQPLGKVTVSVGVASFPGHGKNAEDVLAAADTAVYHSKRSGRNRVTSYESIRETPEAQVCGLKRKNEAA